MIIKFYDNEKYEYPLIEINEDYLNIFKKRLNKYKEDETYNFDDFISLISSEKWFIQLIDIDKEIFF